MDIAQLPADISPIVFDRECGGWLAVAPEDAPLRIGVTAETEAAARNLFRQALERWQQTLDGQRP